MRNPIQKVNAFRDKYERDIRRIVSLSGAVTAAAIEADADLENEFVAVVADELMTFINKVNKRPQPKPVETPANITQLRKANDA